MASPLMSSSIGTPGASAFGTPGASSFGTPTSFGTPGGSFFGTPVGSSYDATSDGGHGGPEAHPDACSARSEGSFALLESSDAFFGSGMRRELLRVVRRSSVMILAGGVGYSGEVAVTALIGHLGSVPLAALALGQMVFNVAGLSLVWGLGVALDTLCAQAHGAQEHALMGVLLQRGLLIMLPVALPCLLLCCNAMPLLTALGQDHKVSHMAATYLRYVAPVLLLEGAAYMVERFLAAQGVVGPLAAVSLLTATAIPGLNYLFLYVLKWPMAMGVALSANITYASGLAVLIGVVAWKDAGKPLEQRAWQGLSPAALQGWGPFLKVAMPCTLQMCLEWWAYEVLVLLAGLLPDAAVQQSAINITFITSMLMWVAQSGVAETANVRVANALGAGSAAAAKLTTLVCVGLAVLVSGISTLAFTLLRDRWVALFTDDKHVLRILVDAMPWMCASLVASSTSELLFAVLNGCNRQMVGVAINLSVYWLLGMPAIAVVPFKMGLGVPGMWMVVTGALVLQSLVLFTWVACMDWEAEVKRAQHMLAAQQQHLQLRRSSSTASLYGSQRSPGGGSDAGSELHEALLPARHERV